ncbi:hypothetical protein E2C01_012643 [Portunus trituberculatus]|uniref:Uncharacterized protein n=1 Tax=Portunus trituberculatus TaxID=210409 RepID=A0A5B7DF56_PORTR|nr:hypothetical protein [Portunus trituberculatus]
MLLKEEVQGRSGGVKLLLYCPCLILSPWYGKERPLRQNRKECCGLRIYTILRNSATLSVIIFFLFTLHPSLLHCDTFFSPSSFASSLSEETWLSFPPLLNCKVCCGLRIYVTL